MLVLCAALGGARRARADAAPCGAAAVRVDIEPDAMEPGLARKVVEQVMSELSGHNAGSCDEKNGMHVEVHWLVRNRVEIRIQVRGDGAEEHAQREIELAGVSEDGRPLAIALAADALLGEVRARLARTLADAHPRVAPAPPAPPAPVGRARAAVLAVGPLLALDTIGGDVLVGADARALVRLGAHLGIDARLGLRSRAGGSDPAPWSAFVAGARLLFAPLSGEHRAGFALDLGSDVMVLRTRGTPSVAVRAVPSAGPVGWIRLDGALSLFGALGLGAAINGVPSSESRAPAFASSAGVGIAARF